MAKKIRIFSQVVLGFATAVTLSYAAAISPAHACEGDSSGQTNCAEAEAVPMLISPSSSSDEDAYSEAGSTLKSEKSIPHSYFQAGYDITSSDAVDGIHFVAGNIIDYSGSSEYGAFGGNSLKINGSIEKDLFVAGSSVEIGEDAAIGRDVYAAASSLIIKANLNGNIFIGGNRL
ncbi:hypothetical protein IKG20_00025, partial [Candidatus Saccharibacteria bacterium]|nr:hypothetical protein [Candidatus Saccharibacteria bacterium]